MKTFGKLFATILISAFTFACAQSQDTGQNEEMNANEDQSAAVQYSDAHQRGNKEARPSPNASVSQTIGTTPITVTYGRPGVKGRTIFGDLEAYGEVWRSGANESTVITFPIDVTIEGQPLEAGSYSVYSIPGQDEWTIIFNSKLSWGTQYDESQDVLRVQVQPQEAPAMEWFMIYFQNLSNDSAEMVLHWNETKVPVTIEV